MKIRGSKRAAPLNPMLPSADLSKPEDKIQEVHATPENAVNVDLSESSRGVRQARAIVAGMSDVRIKKVAELKTSVDEGSYWVESEKIARRIVNEALRESVHTRRSGS